MSFGRIVANLDFEEALNRDAGGPQRKLTARAASSVRLLGTLLRVFAGPRDHVHLSAHVSPGRIAPIPGIPTPTFETGELKMLPPADDWLAWGEVEEVAGLRARDRAKDPTAVESHDDLALWARAWRLPRPIPSIARHVHERATHLAIAEELGYAFPGRMVLRSIDALDAHLNDGGAALSPTGEWILKPMFSAAGRNWIRGIGATIERQAKVAAEKAFGEGHRLVFEPLLERTRDIGSSLAITDAGVETIGLHEIETSSAGKFRGIRIPVRDREDDSFPLRVAAAATKIGERLHAKGYRGPCGIDAWVGRTADGSLHEVLLGEVNARFTFGWVAHAWRDRLGAVGLIDPEGPLDFRTSSESLPPNAAIPLLNPGDHDTLCAWIDTRGRESSQSY